MRLVIQRVNHASVTIDGSIVGSIEKGLLVFLGIGADDTSDMLKRYADKLIKLRIFEDSEGKTNLSLGDVGGSLLIVSQFTLYANCKKGHRPSFIEAGDPQHANRLYKEFIALCKDSCPHVETGRFGADMKVSLENDGPFTIIFDSRDM